MRGLRGPLLAVAGVGLLIGLGIAALIPSSEFVADRWLWVALVPVIGGGFIGVGAFAWLRRPDNKVGALMVATGFAWYLGRLELTEAPLLFSVGMLFDYLAIAVAIHLLLSFPSGRLRGGFDRALVGLAYLVVTVGFVPFVMFTDPVSTLGCPSCPENVFLVDANGSLALAWLDGLSVAGLLVLGWVTILLVGRWREASPPLRRAVSPVYAAGGSLMVLLAAQLVAGLADAPQGVLDACFYATVVPFGLVPYAFLGGLVRARMLRGGAVGRLVARLGGTGERGELAAELTRALGDPSIELAFWIPEAERYVDAEGRAVALPGPGSGRQVSELRPYGRLVAAIIHDASVGEDPELIEGVGAAAALALERERLDAELRAKVEELRDSRARMLKIGLAERRRLERDLHDGAQQHLVSLALDLRLARDRLRADPEAAEHLLDGAADGLSQALEELRELARGIHPAVLSDRGLSPAVEHLARSAPLPVEIAAELEGRAPEGVELAAYYVVSEALANVAKYAGASRATVRLVRDNGRVTVEVADDGVGGADPDRGTGLRGLSDRVATLGGRLEVASQPGAGTRVTASIPCG